MYIRMIYILYTFIQSTQTHIHYTYNIYMYIWGHKIPKTIFQHITLIFYAHRRIHTYTTCLLGLMAQLCVGLEIAVVNKLRLAPLRVDKVRVQRLASTYTHWKYQVAYAYALCFCLHVCICAWILRDRSRDCVVCVLWVRELAHTSQKKSFINTGKNVDKNTPGHCG